MAQVNYSPTPSVEPTDRAPDDYQRIDARPEAFGASIGQGMQALGAGAEKATQFYGQVAADDGTNQFVNRVNKVLYGDPTQMVPQPDGSLGPDTGYNGLKGADKMRAYPDVLKAIETARNEVRQSLSTPESQLQFDQYSRRFAQMKQSELGTEYERAHAEYALNTNKDSAGLTLGEISRQADNDNAFEGARHDLRASYVKAAQTQGLGPEGVKLAVQNADRDAWKQRIETIAANDPERARQMASDHKDELGTQWAAVDEHLRARAVAKQGTEYGTAKANEMIVGKSVNDRPMTYDPKTKQVVFKDTGLPPTEAEARASITTPENLAKGAPTREQAERGPTAAGVGGFGAALGRTFTEEGGYNAHDANGAPVNFGINQKSHPEVDVSKLTREQAAGIYKRDYWDAIGGDELSKTNPSLAHVAFDTAVVEGAGRAKTWLAEAGGDPQKFLALREQYERGLVANDPATYAKYAKTWQSRREHLAADIGLPGGAPATVAQATQGEPRMSPESAAVDENPAGGFPTAISVPGAPAAAPGAPAPAPGAPAAEIAPPDYAALKAKGLREIEDNPKLDWEAKQHARAAFTQVLATHEMLAGESERAKRDANEKAYNGFVTELLGGGGRVSPNFIARVAADPNLTAATKEHLYDRSVHQSGSDVEQKKMEFGPGYWQARQDIVDHKIADPDDIRKMAGPGGTITLAGEDNLRKTLAEVTKSVMTRSVEATRVSMLKYAHDLLSFDQTVLYPGVKPLEDPKGRELFEGQFMPLFDDGFDKWVKAGNEPQKYLTKENVDKLAAGLRTKADMDADKIKAMHETDAQMGLAGKEPPPDYKTPEGIQDEHWKAMVQSAPTLANGARINPEAWVRILDQFGQSPTDAMVKAFDEDQAARSAKGLPTLAVSGQEILAGLRGQIKPVASHPRAAYRPVMTGEKPGQFVSKQ